MKHKAVIAQLCKMTLLRKRKSRRRKKITDLFYNKINNKNVCKSKENNFEIRVDP